MPLPPEMSDNRAVYGRGVRGRQDYQMGRGGREEAARSGASLNVGLTRGSQDALSERETRRTAREQFRNDSTHLYENGGMRAMRHAVGLTEIAGQQRNADARPAE